MFNYHKDGSQPNGSEVFVFGSNLAGIHGAGAARAAHVVYNAKLGIGVGYTGMSYAIPTKDYNIETMDIEDIKPFIRQFVHVTKTQLNDEFFITRIGCGLAGFTDDQIAPLFKGCNPANCSMPEPWREYLES